LQKAEQLAAPVTGYSDDADLDHLSAVTSQPSLLD
jgi:hypothetical protein